jgi:hypothetical protein
VTGRGWKISDFAAFVVGVGVLILMGAWDDERTIRRNLDAGDDTRAMITGANEQHGFRFPLAFDGLRPRFLDQTYSLDLTWRGGDGAERARQKVPVTDEYMASLMVGDKVRLVPVPIKVVDEDGAVPTIAPDATARLDHLNGLATFVGYGTALAALVFVVNFGARWWRRSRSAAAALGPEVEPAAWHIPPRLTLLTILCLGAAGMFGYYSIKEGWEAEAMQVRGRNATAAITDFRATVGDDRRISYMIDLAWRDGSGVERHFGPTHVSDAYAQRIAANGTLVTRQTTIRYLEENPTARPIIVADADERTKNDQLGRVAAMVFGVAGLALAAVTAWRARRG